MNTTPIEFKAIMQRQHDKAIYVSDGYTTDTSFLSYLFDFEEQRWDKFLEQITCEANFILQFPDDEYLNGWSHIGNIQLTALRSTTGEKIYNHMIVKDEYGEHCIIDMFNYKLMYGLYTFHKLEIVGNRFQHSKLLELCK